MKLSIIGAGKVGVTLAFAAMQRNFLREIVLVGRNHTRTAGEALDLAHAQAFMAAPAEIIAGGIADTAGSDVIAFCASVPTPTTLHHRSDLLLGNAQLVRELVPQLCAASPDALILMVSNPVDPLTWHALKASGWPPSRVFGTGTMLDSARFRRALSHELSIHPDDLRAYILGEHGDSQFLAMSTAMAGGESIEDTPHRRDLFHQTAAAGLTIFNLKGYTNFGIAMSAAAILESIALDEKRTMPLSVYLDDYLGVRDVCLSVPVVVGAKGVERLFQPRLNPHEIKEFHASAEVVMTAIRTSF